MKDQIFTILTTICKHKGQMLLNKVWIDACRYYKNAIICSEENCPILTKVRQKI